MNKALEHYLSNDWELVRTTLRWHYIRNRKKPAQLKGQGMMTSRIVRSWYEPIYLLAKSMWQNQRLPKWAAKIILDERW